MHEKIRYIMKYKILRKYSKDNVHSIGDRVVIVLPFVREDKIIPSTVDCHVKDIKLTQNALEYSIKLDGANNSVFILDSKYVFKQNKNIDENHLEKYMMPTFLDVLVN